MFKKFSERPIEFGFVFANLGKIYPLSILDVGVGTTALPHLIRNCGFLIMVTDNIRDCWPVEMVNQHFHVVNDDITAASLIDKFEPHHLY